MAYYKLKENHPTFLKIRQLEELATQLKLTISSRYDGQILITDDDNPEIAFQYRDIEQSVTSYDTTTHFPYRYETKVVFDKD